MGSILIPGGYRRAWDKTELKPTIMDAAVMVVTSVFGWIGNITSAPPPVVAVVAGLLTYAGLIFLKFLGALLSDRADLLEKQLVAVAAERDDAIARLAKWDKEREEIYRVLDNLNIDGFALAARLVKSEEDWAKWKDDLEQFNQRVANSVQYRLPPHEVNRLRHVKYDVKKYVKQFNETHGDSWCGLMATCEVLRGLMESYAPERIATAQ